MKRVALFVFTIAVAGCAGPQGTAPTSPGQPPLVARSAPPRGIVRHHRLFPTSDVSWGVSVEGWSSDGGNKASFIYCDKALTRPFSSTGSCWEYGAPITSVTSISKSHSAAATTGCNEGAEPGTSCSVSVSTRAALGKLSISLSDSVSGLSNPDQYEAAEDVEGESTSSDTITPTSTTLPPGTEVKFRETLEVTGNFNTYCSGVAGSDNAEVSAIGGGTSVSGICNGTTFVFTDGNGGSGETDTGTFYETIGNPFNYQPEIDAALFLFDCSSGAGQCGSPYGSYTGPQSESLSGIQSKVHLRVMTPGASYTTASGHSYQ